MKTLAPNTLLQNRYLVVQLIGKGGMGEVYLAVDQRLGSAVALKRTFFSDDEMLGNAFEREAKTLARLRHPVLPKVSDHFTENETQYLAMEHISGDDLSKRLELTDKPFPLSWVLFWTDQLLDALAYLHSHEPPIVHRDIKPQNLKLTDENHIVLLDFGLAKNSIGNTRVTSASGSIVGYTPHYAPMEQIRGTGTNPRSDLYSLSATVYQLLTNNIPPDALTRADSVLNGLPDPIKPLNNINPEIPKAISDVILKGMSLSMEQRYPDARAMQKALREAYAGMQDSMSANTVAFNNSDLPEKQNAVSEVENPTPVSQIPEQFSAYQGKTESFPAPQNQPPTNDFDATMRDNGNQYLGIKTEVMPKEKIPRAEDFSPLTDQSYAPDVPAKEEFKTEDFQIAPEDDFSSEPAGKEFDAGATIPLIKIDKETDKPASPENYNSGNEAEKTFVPAAIPVLQQDSPAEKEAAPSQKNFVAAAPPPAAAAAQKKSGGKTGFIVAGIGIFFVLAAAAAAIGWYALKPKGTVSESPSPTPYVAETTPTPAVSPTLEPTPEPTVEANTNTSNGNTSEVATTDANTPDSNTSTDSTDKKTNVTQTDARPQNDSRTQNDRATQSQVIPRNTPRTGSTTVGSVRQTPVPPKATPAKTPAKNDRLTPIQ